MESINSKLVVFQSWPDFADSPRALYEYVIRNSNLETFWVVRDERMLDTLHDAGVACALEGTEEADAKIAQARFLVSAAYELAMQKRLGQIFISTWHGFALKLTGFFDSAVSDPGAFPAIRSMTTQFDAVTMTSQAARLFFAGMHACDPRKVFATGFPRNDFLFSEDGQKNLSGLVDAQVLSGKKILYLPTMRKSLKEEGAQFDDNMFNYEDYDAAELDALLERHDAHLFVKFHPSDIALLDQDGQNLPARVVQIDDAMLQDRQLTLYHVLNAFDCLITDYSSAYVDYLLLDRPIVFSCPDLDRYEADRGFCVDDPSLLMPGAIVKTQRELIANLDRILEGRDEFSSDRTRMMPFFHTHADGNASKRTFDVMMEACSKMPADVAKECGYLYFATDSPLHQYAPLETGSVFFDVGNDFNETDKLVFRYQTNRNIGEMSFELPQETKRLRFDPFEMGRYVLQDLRIAIDGEVPDYEIVDGIEIDGITFVPEIDPKIVVPQVRRGARQLTLSFALKGMPTVGQQDVDSMALIIGELRRKSDESRAGRQPNSRKVANRAKRLFGRR